MKKWLVATTLALGTVLVAATLAFAQSGGSPGVEDPAAAGSGARSYPP